MNNLPAAIVRILRLPNLIMIALVQWVVYYMMDLSPDSNFLFAMVLIATHFIAAGGYVLNNAADYELDKENGVNNYADLLSQKQLYYIALFFFIFGLIVSFEVAILSRFAFLGLFIVPAALLVLYGMFLSRYKVLGNIIISLMVAYSPFVVYIVLFSDYIDKVTDVKDSFFMSVFIFIYSFFAFLLNWIREIIKDAQDIKGDLKFGRKSLPISLGIENAKKISGLLYVLFLVCFSYVLMQMLNGAVFYIVFSVIILLSFLFLYLLRKSFVEEDFRKLNLLIKALMLAGMISPLLLTIS